jgi:hypothetical protein
VVFNVEALDVFKGVLAKKLWRRISMKKRLCLVSQVTIDVSLSTVRICRLFYRSNVV